MSSPRSLSLARIATGTPMANKTKAPRRSAHDLFERLTALEKKLADVPTMPKLLTVQDLANLLRTTPTGIKHMRHRGELPDPIDIGSRRLLWRESVVIAWLGHTELRAAEKAPQS